MNKVLSYLYVNRKPLLWSAILSLILLVLSYFNYNLSLFTGVNVANLIKAERLRNNVDEGKHYADSVLLINMAYDKQLVGVYQTQEDKKNDTKAKDSIGTTAITDREKLYNLLNALKGKDYKYIFLDIIFYNNTVPTLADDKLFKLIESMDRVVVAYDNSAQEDLGFADSVKLWSKAGHITYKSSFASPGFKRLSLLQDTMASMPLKVYRELDRKDITRHGIIYTSDGHLCFNNIFVDFPYCIYDSIHRFKAIDYYRFVNHTLRDKESFNNVVDYCSQKYIVIGDYVDDVHDTYAGLQPGPIINYKAYQYIKQGRHLIKPWYIIMFWVLYFCIIFLILKRVNILHRIPVVKKLNSDLINFLLDFVGYGLILSIVAILVYAIFYRVISILLPTMFFSIMKYILKIKELKSSKK